MKLIGVKLTWQARCMANASIIRRAVECLPCLPPVPSTRRQAYQLRIFSRRRRTERSTKVRAVSHKVAVRHSRCSTRAAPTVRNSSRRTRSASARSSASSSARRIASARRVRVRTCSIRTWACNRRSSSRSRNSRESDKI